jgi:hypothetical protein
MKEPDVPQDKPMCGPPDRMHLNPHDEQEINAMAEALCVTPRELRDAIDTTGTDVAALQAHFQSQ